MFSRRSLRTLRILTSTSLLALVSTSLSNAAWAADSDKNDTTPPAVTITVVTPAENPDQPQSAPTDQPATTSVDGSAPVATQAPPVPAAAANLGTPATQEDANGAPANAADPAKEGTGDSLAKPHDNATPADSEAKEATPTSPEVAANFEATPRKQTRHKAAHARRRSLPTLRSQAPLCARPRGGKQLTNPASLRHRKRTRGLQMPPLIGKNPSPIRS